jgi:hypothetical protein
MNKLLSVLVFVLFAGIVVSGPGELMNNICFNIRAIMPVVSLTLLVVAGLIYAIGKVLGQEFRSKTESWATTIVIGAILGLVLAIAAPFIVNTLTESLGMEEMEYTCEELME